MAQIKWQKRAENELFRYLVKGFIEFGETTANNFAATVHIADIWDMRRNPAKLANRIK